MRDHPIVDRSDPTIAVSMVGNLIVLRPSGRLDLESTRTLVNAVDAAAGTDTTVVIDLGGAPGSALGPDLLPTALLDKVATGPHPETAVTLPTIDVIAPGCLRLSSPQSHWTIDLTERRFCRSAEPVDRRFIDPAYWTTIRNVWAGGDGVGVLTWDDSIVSTATRWIAAVA